MELGQFVIECLKDANLTNFWLLKEGSVKIGLKNERFGDSSPEVIYKEKKNGTVGKLVKDAVCSITANAH